MGKIPITKWFSVERRLEVPSVEGDIDMSNTDEPSGTELASSPKDLDTRIVCFLKEDKDPPRLELWEEVSKPTPLKRKVLELDFDAALYLGVMLQGVVDMHKPKSETT
jgi:hypothetical protein